MPEQPEVPLPVRICFELQVREDLLDEYLARHTSVWPGMLAEIAAAGRRNYSLFLGAGGRLIGYYETDDEDAARAYLAASPVAARWEAGMSRYFVGLEGRPDQTATILEEVFNLEGQIRDAVAAGDGSSRAVPARRNRTDPGRIGYRDVMSNPDTTPSGRPVAEVRVTLHSLADGEAESPSRSIRKARSTASMATTSSGSPRCRTCSMWFSGSWPTRSIRWPTVTTSPTTTSGPHFQPDPVPAPSGDPISRRG